MDENKRIRNICFTINNYTEVDIDSLKNSKYKYLIFGKENVSTPHLQGYIEFENAKSFKTLKKLFPRAHLEARRGTPEQASEYCKKEDPNFFEDGEISQQGSRSDLQEVINFIKEHHNLQEIAAMFPVQWIKYERGIRSFYETIQPYRNGRPKCIWLWGAAGVGKSYYAVKIHGRDKIFIKDEAKWWGSYDHEEAILIDDFAPNEWNFRKFLRLLDEGKYEGETKGSHIKVNSNFIYISCEFPPDHFWKENTLEQVETRFEEIIEIRGENQRKKPVRKTIKI